MKRVEWLPFFDDEINGNDHQRKASQVIPGQFVGFEAVNRDERKDRQRDDFLTDFQLEKRERPARLLRANAVGGH